jgi:hypothetical protein
VFVEFVTVIEFKGQTFVKRFPFSRDGSMLMCIDIWCAMKCGAGAVNIADGFVEVEIQGLAIWCDLPFTEVRNRIVRMLSDATMDKKELVRCVREAVDLMIRSSASEQSVD